MAQKGNSHDITRLVHDVYEMNSFDIKSIHGITIDEDGGVEDTINGTTFKNIIAWATSVYEDDLEDDEYAFRENFKSRSKYDDEF